MPTARPTLSATHRSVTGKKVAALRRAGQLPAVVFGHDHPSDNVTVDAKEFEALRRHAGANALIDLSVDGGKASPVLIHGIQQHPTTRRPLHLDLYVVTMTQELTVEVPLVPEGQSEAVEDQGGTLFHVTEHVRVRALPDHLPSSIHYSIESLHTFDDLIHVSDLALPSDITLLTDPGEVVAKVLPPRVEEVEEPVAEAAEGEAPEGEESAAAEGREAREAGSEGESSEG